jgi:hypothetical protein
MPSDISNQAFLEAIFKDCWWHVHVAAFPGDPTIQDGRWTGGLAKDVLADPNHVEMNCYFVPSLLSPIGARRQLRHFGSFHVIVLDDVGTKVDVAAAVIAMGGTKPAWLIKTSAGNYQAGWAITPQTDLARIKRGLAQLRKVLGAGDNLTNPVSYFRLPVGRNWKPTDGAQGWRVRVLPLAGINLPSTGQMTVPYDEGSDR